MPLVIGAILLASATLRAAPIESEDYGGDAATSESSADQSLPTETSPSTEDRLKARPAAARNSIDLLLNMDAKVAPDSGEAPPVSIRSASRTAHLANAPLEAVASEERQVLPLAAASRGMFDERGAGNTGRLRAASHDDVSADRDYAGEGRPVAAFAPRAPGQTAAGPAQRVLDMPLIRFIRANREMLIGFGLATLAAMWATANYRSRRRR